MKTLIGMVTFGNLAFTKLAIGSIFDTTLAPFEMFVIVGKPDDLETSLWLAEQGIPHLAHKENQGFPASLNDLYDVAFPSLNHHPSTLNSASYDSLIIAGNDIVAYPGAVDALIDCARETDYEWICSSQFDAASLVARYPEARQYFAGESLTFNAFTTARPWELHRDFRAPHIEDGAIKDVRNLCLFKRSVFERLGYADANFWPGGYFEDNDYCQRAMLAGVKACGLAHSAYFHFWSRTIHQGGRDGTFHGRTFRACEQFYGTKWGGRFGAEKWQVPFDGRTHLLQTSAAGGIGLEANIKIETRTHESAIIDYWLKQSSC